VRWHAKKEGLDAEFAADVDAIPGPWCVTDGLRSRARQAELYAQGRTTPGEIVTYSKPGQSAHQWGLAADVARIDAEGTLRWDYTHPDWDTLWTYIDRSPRMHSGVHFPTPDEPHIQAVKWYKKRADLIASGGW